MITYHIFSHIGLREINEDAVNIYQEDDCFCAALADGLGGHGMGEIASALAVEGALNIFERKKIVTKECLRQCFEESQNLLLKEQKLRRREWGLKTTLCLLMADEQKIIWGHVGDSRIYHFRNKKLVGRTLDHSVPQALVASGEIKESEIRNHPDRNRLLRVMGSEWYRPAYTLSDICNNEEHQMFLLCSDGFWELIDEQQIEDCLENAENVRDWIKKMSRIVLAKGKNCKMDNSTAIGIWT